MLIYCINISLIYYPLPTYSAYSGGVGQVGQFMGSLSGAMNMIGRQMITQKQQMMQQDRVSQQMQAIQPKVIPSKFFPQCPIAPSMPKFPEGACNNIADQYAYGAGLSYIDIANQNATFLDELSNEAQNAPNPVGIQCLEEAKIKQIENLNDKIKNLAGIIGKLKESNRIFKDNNKGTLDKMKGIMEELDGGGKGDKNEKSLMAQLGKGACGEVLDTSVYSKGIRAGVKNSLTAGGKNSLRETARRFARDNNSGVLKRNIKEQIKRIKNEIKSKGVMKGMQSIASGNKLTKGGLIKFAGIANVIKDKIGEVKEKIAGANKHFKEVGYTLPEMDEEFETNLNKFSKDSLNFFQKSKIDECVTAPGGLGINTDELLNNLKMPAAGAGSTVDSYREAVKAILSEDSFIEDKIARLKELDKGKTGKNRIEVNITSAGKQESMTFSEAIDRTIESCHARFEQDNTYSRSGQDASQSKKVKKAQKAIEDIKKVTREFEADLLSSIEEEMFQCGGRDKTRRAGSCNAGSMTPESGEFCMSFASECANNVSHCLAKTEALIQSKENEKENLAKAYNKSVKQHFEKQKSYIQMIQQQVFTDVQFIRNYFPGTDWSLPTKGFDPFINPPEEMPGSFEGKNLDTKLLGGGKQDFLKTFPQRLQAMMGILEGQKKKVAGSIDAYIKKQKAAMMKNKGAWEQFAKQCSKSTQAFQQQSMKQAQQQAAARQKAEKEEREAQQKAERFCNKFENMAESGPVPGCDDDKDGSASKLFTEANDVTSWINYSWVSEQINAYKDLCAQSQNERTRGADDDEESLSDLARRCQEHDNDWNEVKKDIKKEILELYPGSSFGATKAEVESYLDSDGTGSLDEDILNTRYGSTLSRYASMVKMANDKTKARDGAYFSTKVEESIEVGRGCDIERQARDDAQCAHTPTAVGCSSSSTASSTSSPTTQSQSSPTTQSSTSTSTSSPTTQSQSSPATQSSTSTSTSSPTARTPSPPPPQSSTSTSTSTSSSTSTHSLIEKIDRDRYFAHSDRERTNIIEKLISYTIREGWAGTLQNLEYAQKRLDDCETAQKGKMSRTRLDQLKGRLNNNEHHENMCVFMNKEIEIAAHLACKDKNFSTSCIEEETAKRQSKLTGTSLAKSVNNRLKNLDLLNSAVQQRWTRIGENADESCLSVSGQGMGKMMERTFMEEFGMPLYDGADSSIFY